MGDSRWPTQQAVAGVAKDPDRTGTGLQVPINIDDGGYRAQRHPYLLE
jgi:hypothetical protein